MPALVLAPGSDVIATRDNGLPSGAGGGWSGGGGGSLGTVSVPHPAAPNAIENMSVDNEARNGIVVLPSGLPASGAPRPRAPAPMRARCANSARIIDLLHVAWVDGRPQLGNRRPARVGRRQQSRDCRSR